MNLLAIAQQNDAVGTVGVQLEKKINRTFSVVYYSQLALNENYTELGYALFDFGTNIKLNSRFTFGANYRVATIKGLDNQFDERYFLYSDLSYNKSFGDFVINIRTRFVTKQYGFHSNEDLNYKDDKHYFRNKIQLKYEFNYNYSLFVSDEQIYRLDLLNKTEQWRYTAGINYQINAYNRLQFSYSINRDVNTRQPDTNYITGITYYFKF